MCVTLGSTASRLEVELSCVIVDLAAGFRSNRLGLRCPNLLDELLLLLLLCLDHRSFQTRSNTRLDERVGIFGDLDRGRSLSERVESRPRCELLLLLLDNHSLLGNDHLPLLLLEGMLLLHGSGLLLLLEGVEGIELGPGGCCDCGGNGRKLVELVRFLGGLLLTELVVLLDNHGSGCGHLTLDGHRLRSGGTESTGTSTSGDILGSIALIDRVVEELSLAAPVHAGTSLDAHVVDLAIAGMTVEVEMGDGVGDGLLRAGEAHECLCVTVVDLVGPLATVRLLAEGQTLRAVKHESTAIDAVHELATVDAIAHLEVAKLVGALIGGLDGFGGKVEGSG